MITVILASVMLHGGVDLVHQVWNANGKGFEHLIKWPVVLIGIPGGVLIGAYIFRWFVLRAGNLTQEEKTQIFGQ